MANRSKRGSTYRRSRIADLPALSEENAAFLAEFGDSLRARGRGHRTISAYLSDIEQLARTYAHGAEVSEPGELPLTRVTPAGFEDWWIDMSQGGPGEDPWKPSTARRKRSAIHRFYTWLITKKELDLRDPTLSIELRAGSDADFRANIRERLLSPGQVDAIFTHLKDHAESSCEAYAGLEPDAVEHQVLMHLIDVCVLGFSYFFGARIFEAVELKRSDVIVLPNGEITVRGRGKGDEPFEWPVHPEILPYMHRYLEVRKSLPVERSAANVVFIYPPTRRALTRQLAFKRVRAASIAALGEAGAYVSPHWFRHALATHLIVEGNPANVVRDVLRHKSLTTTNIYVETMKDEAVETARERGLSEAAAAWDKRFRR